VGGRFHPKLNTCGRPIANKYREGKMKRTLKRESKVLEIAGIEGMASSIGRGIFG
jgi:DNA-directed RNA polymerase subunit N (RpoN/RPB10)